MCLFEEDRVLQKVLVFANVHVENLLVVTENLSEKIERQRHHKGILINKHYRFLARRRKYIAFEGTHIWIAAELHIVAAFENLIVNSVCDLFCDEQLRVEAAQGFGVG